MDARVAKLYTGEIIMYVKDSGRFSITRPEHTKRTGETIAQKSISVDLKGNRDNKELIQLLEYVLGVLK